MSQITLERQIAEAIFKRHENAFRSVLVEWKRSGRLLANVTAIDVLDYFDFHIHLSKMEGDVDLVDLIHDALPVLIGRAAAEKVYKELTKMIHQFIDEIDGE